MGLFEGFDLNVKPVKKAVAENKIKLKKGDSISSLIATAKSLVEEKLKDYKNVSKCITNLKDLKDFFDNTPEDAPIGIDTETTG